MSLAGRNAFALLNDDADDAGLDSVNTDAIKAGNKTTTNEKPSPSTTMNGASGPNSKNAGTKSANARQTAVGPDRRRGDRRGGGGGGAGGGFEGKEERAAKHSDRRDKPDYKPAGRGERNERKSHTGRGKEVKKNGAGGRYTLGNERRDAARGENAANAAFSSGASDADAISEVIRAEAGEDGGADVAGEGSPESANVEGGVETEGNEDGGEDGEEVELEEPVRAMTLEEALEQKRNAGASIVGVEKKETRKANDGESVKAMKKLQKQTVDFAFASGEDESSSAANAAAAGAKTSVAAVESTKDATAAKIEKDLTRSLFRQAGGADSAGSSRRDGPPRGGGDRRGQRDHRRGGGDRRNFSSRGGGGGGRYSSGAPNMDDTSAFPTLGA
mmetsp:Transcript_5468/g.11520  ORF Transcript_5468/g.11520 Transcript_5468/m.11520 type:complete len:388 (-) Transcript_5468:91-1254(-)